MKNLSFLKGLFVGIAIATIGAVAYANSAISSSNSVAYVVIDDEVFFCTPEPSCQLATMTREWQKYEN